MASTFKSNDIAISDILKGIANGANQLPDFQRGWVWDDNRIKSLIASISNAYPVGALMFLEYGGDSIRFYYLDIKQCLDTSVDRADAILSIPQDKVVRSNFGRDIELDLSNREQEFSNHMFPLNIVYDSIACTRWQNDYQKHHGYAADILERYANFIADVLVPIQSYKVPVITLSKDTPKDAVCQVFENVNTGGVSLTVFELITATFAADNFELRKDWEVRATTFVQKSAWSVSDQDKALLTVVSSTDFLTALTLLSRYYINVAGGEAISCKKKDVLRISLSEYNQYADVLSDGFVQAASFLKEQRIFSARDLPYSTQLIPLSVIFAILGAKSQDNTVRSKLAQWYWCGVLGEMYGGANETRYANDVGGVIKWIDGGSEPDTVQRAYFQPTRLLSLQTRLSAAYEGIMALILKAGCLDFISGVSMDFTVFFDENTDIHHIFPTAYCEAQGIVRGKFNSIVNKTPLFARTNKIIGGTAPSIYLANIEKNSHVTANSLNIFAATHLIDVQDLRADSFDSYFIKRAKSYDKKDDKLSLSQRFKLAHDFSMGLKSGKYGGKKRSLTPASLASIFSFSLG